MHRIFISNEFFTDVKCKMAEDFQAQNPELFDTVFKIDGKKLFAHKYHLSLVSSTFKSMLSDRWNSNANDAIKINGYSYDNFKEMLTFIYSGECNITDENIFTMIDMAEFYQIPHLKKLCDTILSKKEINVENVFQLIELSNKYSLTKMKESLKTYIFQNVSDFLENNQFLKIDKCVIEEMLITSKTKFLTQPEKFFKAIYQWAEYQTEQRQKESIDENFNLNDAIKKEITPFLPYIQFKKMKIEFLNTFVVEKGFIFTNDELRDILDHDTSLVTVKFTNSDEQSIYGTIPATSEAVEIIKSLKDFPSRHYSLDRSVSWNEKCQIPSYPISIEQRNGVEWYLVYFTDGYLGIQYYTGIDEYCILIAEMIPKDEFQFTPNCKIEIE